MFERVVTMYNHSSSPLNILVTFFISMKRCYYGAIKDILNKISKYHCKMHRHRMRKKFV